MSRPRKKTGRGALALMALLLASSGALRLGEGIGAALANSETTVEAPDPTPESCEPLPTALANALKDREVAVTAREDTAAEKEVALELAKEVIDKKLKELAAAQEELQKTLKLADGAAEADLSRLTTVYEAMKPKDAANIFASMTPEFAAGFLGRMNPAIAASVLAGMDPEKAYSISVLIAGRNALVPKE